MNQKKNADGLCSRKSGTQLLSGNGLADNLIRWILAIAMMFGLMARAIALPGPDGITGYQAGSLDQTEIGYSLRFDASDMGRAVQVYVLLQLDQTVLALDASGQLKPISALPVPFSTLTPTVTQVRRALPGSLPLLDLPAFKVVVGYGLSWEEMLSAQRFKQVFPDEGSVTTFPALPAPATPYARAQAQALLKQLSLRMSVYNLSDPATANQTDLLRAAALYDQVVRALTKQAMAEEKVLRDASTTGKLDLGQGEAVTFPIDPAGQTPAFCTGQVTCRRSTDPDTGEPQLTVVNAAFPTASAPIVPAASLPVGGIDWPGLVQSGYPLSITQKRCMPWALNCTQSQPLTSASLGEGYESLAMSVKSQADAMLSQCASYIEGVYRSQNSPTYGNGDAAQVSGTFLPHSRTYYLSCKEVAFFWTYTKGTLFEAQINVDDGTARATAIAGKLTTFADTKRLSVQKMAANLVVGQVPYLNVVNSGVKCLFGTSGVDMLINTFARTVNGLACRQTALNLATSVFPVLKTIPVPIANTGSATTALGVTLTVLDAGDDFWGRASYSYTTSNQRYGLFRP